LLKTLKLKDLEHRANVAISYAPCWGDKLKKHIKIAHEKDRIDGAWSEEWNRFFQRTKISLDNIQVKAPTTLERLLEGKRCVMACDFAVTERWKSVWKVKLLKHYCTQHFRAKLLGMEDDYFTGDRFPYCRHCGFEMKRSGEMAHTVIN
jgi:hypothetical protein